MKLIKTKDAVGHVLCHDITQIICGVSKGPVFRKGHIVTEEDIPVLLSVGKENLYIWEKGETRLHEDEGAAILRDIAMGENMEASAPKEGKIGIKATCDGVLTVDTKRLDAINGLGEMMIATRHGGFPVKKGDDLAGMRIIPLVIEKEKMEKAKAVAGHKPLLAVHPFTAKTAGVVTTGSEVYYHRIEDTFTPVIVDKLSEYGIEMTHHVTLSDDADVIAAAINNMIAGGVDLILCTGGMSVDPDDRTPLAIRNTGADIISYGSPVLPGAMLLVAYKGNVPILGLPGCVMYSKRTVFDLVLPSLAAGIPITARQLSHLGEGGLCLNCKVCTFPQCGFGR